MPKSTHNEASDSDFIKQPPVISIPGVTFETQKQTVRATASSPSDKPHLRTLSIVEEILIKTQVQQIPTLKESDDEHNDEDSETNI